MPASGHCVHHRVCRSSGLAQNRVRVRTVVEAAGNPADFAISHQPGQHHADPTRIAQICEIMRGKGPAPALLRHSAENSLVIGFG